MVAGSQLINNVVCGYFFKLTSLHTLHDEVRHPFELELSWISEETKWQHHLVPDNLRDEVNEWAVQSIKEDEMDDEDEDED